MQGARKVRPSLFDYLGLQTNKGIGLRVKPGDPYQNIRKSASLEQQLDPYEMIFFNSRSPKSKKHSLSFAAGVTMRAFHVIDIDRIVTIELSDKESVFGLFACVTATAPLNASQDDQILAPATFDLVGTLDRNHCVL